MAEEFEVRGAHEDHMDEAAERAPNSIAGQLAVMTALLATVGAMFSYMAGATQADAGLFKNDAAIRKTEASNQWNYYQAKNNRQSLSELGAQLADDTRKPFFEKEAKRYATEKLDIKRRLKSSKKSPPTSTPRAKRRCTSTTAGHRPPPPCRSPLRWPPLRFSRESAGSKRPCSS